MLACSKVTLTFLGSGFAASSLTLRVCALALPCGRKSGFPAAFCHFCSGKATTTTSVADLNTAHSILSFGIRCSQALYNPTVNVSSGFEVAVSLIPTARFPPTSGPVSGEFSARFPVGIGALYWLGVIRGFDQCFKLTSAAFSLLRTTGCLYPQYSSVCRRKPFQPPAALARSGFEVLSRSGLRKLRVLDQKLTFADR